MSIANKSQVLVMLWARGQPAESRCPLGHLGWGGRDKQQKGNTGMDIQ